MLQLAGLLTVALYAARVNAQVQQWGQCGGLSYTGSTSQFMIT